MVDIALLNVYRAEAVLLALQKHDVKVGSDVTALFAPGGAYATKPGLLQEELTGGTYQKAIWRWVKDEAWAEDRRAKRGELQHAHSLCGLPDSRPSVRARFPSSCCPSPTLPVLTALCRVYVR